MRELTLQATAAALGQVQAFVEEELELAGAPMQVMMQISICVEEIYMNIANYAYQPQEGAVTIRCTVAQEPSSITIVFEDQGVVFNPIAKTDADTHLSAQEREIGGLGILMVKKMMDTTSYRRENNKNIFSMVKIWE